jgi:hypothetical protein
MADDKQSCRNSVVAGGIAGPIWFIGWLFTVGFVGLSFWKAVLALIVWPYLLGVALR